MLSPEVLKFRLAVLENPTIVDWGIRPMLASLRHEQWAEIRKAALIAANRGDAQRRFAEVALNKIASEDLSRAKMRQLAILTLKQLDGMKIAEMKERLQRRGDGASA